MSLCRHFVRGLRRSVLLETPEAQAQKENSKRSSQILDSFGQLDDERNPEDEKLKDQHVSAFLRENGDKHSPQNSNGSRHSPPKSISSSRGERAPRPGFLGADPDTTDSNSPGHTVARADLRASAEKILYTYLLPGSEREIILPQSILNDIIVSIEEDNRDDPEVFDAAKDYVYQAMERDAFPGFLRSKALGNLVPPSMFARLVLGLLAIFGGLWAGFACIFLDLPRSTRCWVSFSPDSYLYPQSSQANGMQLILPFTIGVYSLASQQYALDPILALLGFSEYTFMNWARIRDPYVRSLLNRRALMNLAITVLIGAAVIVLFIFVPGKRL